VIVRDALAADVPAITMLHNAWIPTLTITWTDALQTEEECARWLDGQNAAGRPVLVAEDAGVVVGYATYAPFRGEGASSGYRGTVEQSIHVHEEHWGRGAGRALVEALAERAQAAGVHVIVAGIDSANEASIRFHARLGFVEVARMPETGQKFGRWLHLVLMQRILDSRPAPD
jgi:phosphinothricin acetyltransferase